MWKWNREDGNDTLGRKAAKGKVSAGREMFERSGNKGGQVTATRVKYQRGPPPAQIQLPTAAPPAPVVPPKIALPAEVPPVSTGGGMRSSLRRSLRGLKSAIGGIAAGSAKHEGQTWGGENDDDWDTSANDDLPADPYNRSAFAGQQRRISAKRQSARRSMPRAPAPAPNAIAPPSSPPPEPPVAPAAPPAPSPVTFVRNQWIVDGATADHGDVKVQVERTMHAVAVYGSSKGSTIRVSGKCASLQVEGCSYTHVYVESIVGTLQISNCQRVKIFVRGVVPSISIDKSDGVYLVLSEECVALEDFMITGANSSDMNASFPFNGELVELPIPEQFVHHLDMSSGSGRIESSVSSLYMEQ